MWYIHTMAYYSAFEKKKKENPATCNNMDKPEEHYAE